MHVLVKIGKSRKSSQNIFMKTSCERWMFYQRLEYVGRRNEVIEIGESSSQSVFVEARFLSRIIISYRTKVLAAVSLFDEKC